MSKAKQACLSFTMQGLGPQCSKPAQEGSKYCHIHKVNHYPNQAQGAPKIELTSVPKLNKTTGQLAINHKSYCNNYIKKAECIQADTCIWSGNMCKKGWGKKVVDLIEKKDTSAKIIGRHVRQYLAKKKAAPSKTVYTDPYELD